MAATHHELGNLKVILDRNRIQNDDFCLEQMRMFDIPAKWKAFGWNVMEIDGHDMTEIVDGIKFLDESNDAPSILIAHTSKEKAFPTWKTILRSMVLHRTKNNLIWP